MPVNRYKRRKLNERDVKKNVEFRSCGMHARVACADGFGGGADAKRRFGNIVFCGKIYVNASDKMKENAEEKM